MNFLVKEWSGKLTGLRNVHGTALSRIGTRSVGGIVTTVPVVFTTPSQKPAKREEQGER